MNHAARALVLATSLLGAGLDVDAATDETWSEEQADALLEKTLTVRIEADLSDLTEAERSAADKLLQVGAIMQRLYEDARHPDAPRARRQLARLPDSPHARKLRDLYRMFRGPVATTLENERQPFLPVGAETPGKNVYPPGIERAEVDAFLEEHPEERDAILHVRTVVRRAGMDQIVGDQTALRQFPILDVLHPGLRGKLDELRRGRSFSVLYAVPYSVAYAAELMEAYRLLRAAAADVAAEDPDLAAYLDHRARDLLADDYEAGDASWVTGRFGRLNAQIGSYETYDDALYGVKSFFSLSLLVRDEESSRKLAEATRGLQELQDALPYDGTKRVRAEIPVGIYDIVADFGQARSTNTATILPNESDHARKYGRTILMRNNILRHPDLFDIARAAFDAAVDPSHAGDLTPDGNFERTLWHEVGHYLGPDRTADGRELGAALSPHADLLEEMKADLVSLLSARALRARGYLDDRGLRSFYASGVRRVLQNVKPRPTQPYQTMQLMQWNFFLDRGLLRFAEGRLHIDYDLYHDVVRELLSKVLALQERGDADAAGGFVERWATWDEELHGVIARGIRESGRYRYRLVRYAALGE